MAIKMFTRLGKRDWIVDRRQLLYSTVITNNSKNNKNCLDAASRVAYRYNFRTRSMSTNPVVEAPPPTTKSNSNDDKINWMKNVSGVDEVFLTGKRPDAWWSGIKPTSDQLKNGIRALPQLRLDQVNANDVKNYFQNSWLLTDVLFSGLQGEEPFYRPPYHNLRHPLIFYYGHPTCFYVNKLRVAGLVGNGLDPHFEEIFEVGVDEMRWDDISTVQKDWPKVGEVNKYRKQVFKTVNDVIDEQFAKTKSGTMAITERDPLWALMMGIEHEKIHLETSSVLFRELPFRLVKKPEGFPEIHSSAAQFAAKHRASSIGFKAPVVGDDFPTNDLVKISGGNVSIGKNRDFPSFGWDNEYGSREQTVPNFSVSKFKITNGEFYEFVKSGGYRDRQFWSEDGWGWRVFRNQKWPYFWKQRGPAGSHEYVLRTVFEEIDMPWNWPVNVNYHEASAFCNWKSKQTGKKLRLITEAEHHLIRNKDNKPEKGAVKKCISLHQGANGNANIHLKFGSESPVDALPPSDKGIYDVFGNAWEWAEDDFNALHGFKVHPYYDDFSSPCFDGEHNMILGGSFISCSDAGANSFSRYHFRPHFLQHSSFRYVEPSKAEPNIKGQGVATFLGTKTQHSALATTVYVKEVAEEMQKKTEKHLKEELDYESKRLLDQYMALHFGQSAMNVDGTIRKHEGRPEHALNFVKRTAQELAELSKKHGTVSGPSNRAGNRRALDVGCAVGGSTFELAKYFDEVVGFDYSASFVDQANKVKENPVESDIYFQVPVSGEKYSEFIKADLPSFEVRQKAQFLVGDATKLDEMGLGTFDAILLANLLCRLPNPKQMLDQLPKHVNKNGVVLFVSPYSWLEEFTPKENWIHGETHLCDIMQEKGFQLVKKKDMPLMIREHERKYQYIVSQALGFVKK